MTTRPENRPSSEAPFPSAGEVSLAAQIRRLRHDLRNPLSDILGFSEILQEEAAQEESCVCRDDLRTIHQLAAGILQEVNQTLTVHKVQSIPASMALLARGIRSTAQQIIVLAEDASLKCDQTENNVVGDDLLRISGAARRLEGLAPLLAALETAPERIGTEPGQGPEGGDGFHSAPDEDDPDGAMPSALQPDHGHLLVVDDEESNRALLARRLRRQGYTVSLAENGRQALAKLARQPFDLVLLDILMPEMDGYQVLNAIKEQEAHRHLPVIMTSAIDDLDSLVRCILRGADDYLTKPFDPVVLRARVGSSLEKKRLHDREQETYQALLESQQQLTAELADAAAYVQSLLPQPLNDSIKADWQFICSARLGGDAFDYFWLDEDHLLIYLLDVCSHGVGSALLSVSVLNVLRSRALPETDFRTPDAVLRALNEAFSMDRHHHLYFTMWYGVYQPSRQTLRYASAGHPPALLLNGIDQASAQPEHLYTRGPIVGVMPQVDHTTRQVALQPYSTLYLFSDGAYEIARPGGHMLTLAELQDLLVRADATEPDPLGATLRSLRTLAGRETFDDDLSLVRIALTRPARTAPGKDPSYRTDVTSPN